MSTGRIPDKMQISAARQKNGSPGVSHSEKREKIGQKGQNNQF
ncbi:MULTISPECIES: hypothetical protein [unclassified Mesorhizobium]|nr:MULTISPECIES: hypothetical protein [unclassified Mesorhizobium]